jgi:GntR family transcriptional regulator
VSASLVILIALPSNRRLVVSAWSHRAALPSESELVAQFGASRPTVRRALRELQLRGLIRTRQGKGSFVRTPSPIAITLIAENYRRHQREGRRGFDAQVREQGHRPHQEIIEVATIPAPPEVAERLGLREGAAVVIRRLRLMSMTNRCSSSTSTTTQSS